MVDQGYNFDEKYTASTCKHELGGKCHSNILNNMDTTTDYIIPHTLHVCVTNTKIPIIKK